MTPSRASLTRAAVLSALLAACSVALALALPAAPSPSSLPRADAGSGTTTQKTADDRGARALAALHYPWRDLGYAVQFRPYQGSQLGVTDRRARRITVYVKSGQSDQSLRMTLGHELGHALDFGHGDADRHARYRRLRGLPQSGDWYPGTGSTDYRSDAGDWAEVFGYWLAGAGDFRSERGPAPTAAQLRRLEPLFRVPAPEPAPTASPTPTPSPSASPSASSGLPLLA